MSCFVYRLVLQHLSFLDYLGLSSLVYPDVHDHIISTRIPITIRASVLRNNCIQQAAL